MFGFGVLDLLVLLLCSQHVCFAEMQAASVADDVKAFCKSNKGGAVSVSFVSGKVDNATVDIDG